MNEQCFRRSCTDCFFLSLLLIFSFLFSTRSVTRTGIRLGVGLLIGVVVVACGYGVFGSAWEEPLTVLFIELLKYPSPTLLISMLFYCCSLPWRALKMIGSAFLKLLELLFQIVMACK